MNGATQAPRPVASSSTPVVLCPGLVCDHAVWQCQIEALAQAGVQRPFQVMAWGLRDSLAAMAEQVLAEITSPTFALAGHSMGGRVALEVMRLAPHRVERLALMDTGVHPLAPGEAGDAERRNRMALVEIAQSRGMREMGRQWGYNMVHPDFRTGPVFEGILDMIERSSPAQFRAQQAALLARRDAAADLRQVTCPTLILCGEDDAWSPPAQHRTLHGLCPHASLVIVPHAGHMVTMEQPQAVTEAMRNWLQTA